MFIPRRHLIWAAVCPIILAALCGLWLFTTRYHSTPAWIELGLGPQITYVDDYAKGVDISAEAAILVENSTGTVLYAKNEHIRRAPASTTKILTALLVLERGRLSDTVTVSRNAAWTGGSTARLSPGQKLTVEELLHGLLLPSGNDAGVALAEYMSGSTEEFAALMNKRSQELGATNSQWKNPHGLDRPGHYSTAFDLAMISRVALLYPKFGEIVGTKTYAPQNANLGAWNNTNRLLWSYAGINGIKTGTTSKAGHCLVAAASRDGRQLISVVLGSRNRWADSVKLLNYGFNNFHLIPIASKGQVMAEIKLEGAVLPSVKAVALQDFKEVVRDSDVDDIQTTVVLDPVDPPVRKGQPLGYVVAYLKDRELGSVPLVASETVRRKTLWNQFLHWLDVWWPRRCRVEGPG